MTENHRGKMTRRRSYLTVTPGKTVASPGNVVVAIQRREIVLYPEFATYEMRNPKPGKGLGYFVAQFFAPTNQNMLAEALRERRSPHVKSL